MKLELAKKNPVGAMACISVIVVPLILGACDDHATRTADGRELQGVLVNAEGKPMPGVEVKAYTLNSIGTRGGSADAAAQAVTDKQGRYNLAGLSKGSYNVFARQLNGSKGLLIPEVEYGEGEMYLGVDTLAASGSITGRVLVGGEPAEEVFCHIPGSSMVAVTGEDGRFTLGNVPPGAYSLKYLGQDLRSVADSGVTVVSEEITALPTIAMLFDSRLQPAAPTGLTAAMYDAGLSTIRLAWNTPASGDLKEYRLHTRFFSLADESDPAAEFSEVFAASDSTSYLDTTSWMVFRGGSALARHDSAIVEFSLEAIDSAGNPSRGRSNAVRVRYAALPWERTDVTLTEITGLSDTTRCQDTLVFVVNPSNPVLDTAWYRWSIDAWKDGQRLQYFFESKAVGQLNSGTQPDTLVWWYDRGVVGEDTRLVPDSLSVGASVTNGYDKRYNEVRKFQDLKMSEKGCYRKAGPEHY